MSSFRRRLGRTGIAGAEDTEDNAGGSGISNCGPSASGSGSGNYPYTASKKARKQRHHHQRKQSAIKGSAVKGHTRGSSASVPSSSTNSINSNHYNSHSGRARSASDHATPKINATRSPRAAASARARRNRRQPSFGSQRVSAPPASPSRSAATASSSISAVSFSSVVSSGSSSAASTSLPATGLLLMGKAQEVRVQQQQQQNNTLSSQLFEKLSRRMGGLISPTAAAAAARSKDTSQSSSSMKEQDVLAKFDPPRGSSNSGKNAHDDDAGSSPGIERKSSSSLSHEELAERLSHQLHYRATVAKAESSKEQETKTDRSSLRAARSGASTAPSTPKGRFRGGMGIGSSSPVRNARTRSPPSPSSRKTQSLEIRERQLREELERRGQDLLRRHKARKAAGKPTNIIPYIPPNPSPEQKGHSSHQPPGSPHRYKNLKLPSGAQHAGLLSASAAAGGGRGLSPHHHRYGAGSSSSSNGGLQALTSSPNHKGGGGGGGAAPGLGSLSDLGILGTRKQIAPPPKSKRRIAHAGSQSRAGAGGGGGMEDGTADGARDNGGGSNVAADGSSEGTAQSYERPRHRRLRLREKIVAVLDRINDANVPIVAAGACRYDLGEKNRIISDKKDRCTIQVGHLSVGTEEGNMYNVEVVIKNQIVSSDSDDFEEVLEDFCIECVTGWAVSKFKDYWEASFHKYDDDADINSEFDAGEDDFDDDSVSHESGDNIFLSLAQGREEVDDDFGGKGGHRNRATTTNTALAQYLMGSNSQTLLTLIQHARRWTNSLVPAAKKTRINTTFAAAVERVGSRDDEDYDPEIHKYNLLIVMQFSRPAFPPSYRAASSSRLSMDLADWVQADSFWKCIREGGGDTGERAVSRISFLDDEGNTFIYNMEEAMKNHICLELAKALVELWRTGYLHCDIKPANFIVCANDYQSKTARRRTTRRFASNCKNIKLKLIDFGEGGRKSEIQGIIAGTDWYMAPEMKDFGTPSIQSEVYSTGVSMIEIWYGELWDGKRSAAKCLSDAITNISARNSIVGQFLQRCLAKDPENRPYPYDLYTFFAGQCSAESAIHFGGDEGHTSSTGGVRKTLEDQELRLREQEAKQQRRREEQEVKKLERRRAEQQRRDKYRRQRQNGNGGGD